MKTTLNVIRTGLAASICISLLAACDGRGATAFKSHRYTPEQYAEHQRLQAEKAAREAGNGNPNDLPAVNPEAGGGGQPPKPEIYEPEPKALPSAPNGPVGGAPTTPSGNAGSTTPAAPSTGGDQKPVEGKGPEGKADGQASDGKATLDPSSKFFVEFGKLEEEQRKIVKRDRLTKLVDEKVQAPADEQAAAILKEISFSKPGKDLEISLKAALLTKDGQERFLFVEGAPVGYDKDGDVIPLDSELHETREMNGQPIPKGESLFTMAYCPTADCKFIQVLFDFAGDSKRVYAAFILEVKADGYKIVHHNLGPGLKAFSEAKKSEADGQTSVGEAPIVGHEVAAGAADVTAVAPKKEEQKAEGQKQDTQKAEGQKVDSKAQVRDGETFAQYNERRKQELAANPLNLPDQPATTAELVKAGVAPQSADLFAINSRAADKFELKPVATADSGKGPTVAAAAALKPTSVADGSMARAAELRAQERTQEVTASATGGGSMARAAELRAQERTQDTAVASAKSSIRYGKSINASATAKSNVSYAELKRASDARTQERKQQAAAAAAKVQTAAARK